MRLIESLKNKKFILFNIFLTLYIGINLIGGERGLISFYEKQKIYDNLVLSEKKLSSLLLDSPLIFKATNIADVSISDSSPFIIFSNKI